MFVRILSGKHGKNRHNETSYYKAKNVGHVGRRSSQNKAKITHFMVSNYLNLFAALVPISPVLNSEWLGRTELRHSTINTDGGP